MLRLRWRRNVLVLFVCCSLRVVGRVVRFAIFALAFTFSWLSFRSALAWSFRRVALLSYVFVNFALPEEGVCDHLREAVGECGSFVKEFANFLPALPFRDHHGS